MSGELGVTGLRGGLELGARDPYDSIRVTPA
jgi:hypothetical protein